MPLLVLLLACAGPDDPGDGDRTPIFGLGGDDDAPEYTDEQRDILDDARPTAVSSEVCAECGGDCVVEAVEYAERYHTTWAIPYEDTPPAGGPHSYCWWPAGPSDEIVPDERWVHSLEHGTVVFLYDCPAGCETAVASMRSFGDEVGWDNLIVTPYDGLDGGFAAVAFGHRQVMGCFDEAAFRAFYAARVDQGPEGYMDPPAECL